MNHTIVEAIYAIRHKESGEFVRANGKSCWMSTGAAQSSWCASNSTHFAANGKWVNQSEYKIVDVLADRSEQWKDAYSVGFEAAKSLYQKQIESLYYEIELLKNNLHEGT